MGYLFDLLKPVIGAPLSVLVLIIGIAYSILTLASPVLVLLLFLKVRAAK